jgi:putative transposase
MNLYPENYHHIYNRSNNGEIIFKSPENYIYFLSKYRKYLSEDFDTIAYCLMPTHFHFLVYVKKINIISTKKKFGLFLSSYTKALNQQYKRHGSLFQEHTRSKHIDNDSYLSTLVTYIHQNPVRSKLVEKLEDWEFSSYRDYIGLRNGTLPKIEQILSSFAGIDEFKRFSEIVLKSIEEKYWV